MAKQEDCDNVFNLIQASIGRALALRLIAFMPRTSNRPNRIVFYIPSNPETFHAHHPIVQAIGLDAALKLSKDLGGESVQTTSGIALLREFRNNAIYHSFKQGCRIASIAVAMNLSERTIYNILKAKYGSIIPKKKYRSFKLHRMKQK